MPQLHKRGGRKTPTAGVMGLSLWPSFANADMLDFACPVLLLGLLDRDELPRNRIASYKSGSGYLTHSKCSPLPIKMGMAMALAHDLCGARCYLAVDGEHRSARMALSLYCPPTQSTTLLSEKPHRRSGAFQLQRVYDTSFTSRGTANSVGEDLSPLPVVVPVRGRSKLGHHPKTSTARLLDLKDGGSGVLSKFIVAYKTETKDFTGPGLTEPVLVLYDNDDGAKSIRNTIKNVSNVLPTGTEPFVHVIKNLYAVSTPLGANAPSSKIEDFFDDSIKGTVINGKTFNPGKGFDRDKHYSKQVFAHKAVRPKADTIDFSGFRPLLTNLTAAINKHKASVVP